MGLLEKPKIPEYEQFRKAIHQEMLEKTLAVLKDYLDLQLFDESKAHYKRL